MSLVATAGRLTLEQLQEQVRQADPSAVLVPRRILRRVIRQHRKLSGPGLFVPHRKSYIIPRDALLAIASPHELGVPSAASLPESVLLLAQPSAERLACSPPGQVRQRYWRLLFHAGVHRLLDRFRADGRLDEAAVRDRADRIGTGEFEEAAAVLKQENFLLADDPAAVYEEFVAVYLELRVFDPARMARFFPAIVHYEAVDHVLGGDVDAEQLLARTRVEGADEPGYVPPPETAETELPSPGEARAPGELRARAEEVSRRGNEVRAAILRVQAVAKAPPSQAGALRGAARQDIVRLVKRLQRALGFPEREQDDWVRCLWALVEPAARGFWAGEARLLYDLQKVCLDREKPVYAADLVEWFVSGFRRPIKRPLPHLPLVLAVKNLRKARLRLAAAHIPAGEHHRLDELITSSLAAAELRLRTTLRPGVVEALDTVGLSPASAAERMARDRLVEELLDRVVERGHLNMSDLRDALARNRLKLPDLRGPLEFFAGDPLIKANRELAARLDGVYHRGEIYLRWLQRLSSLFFGNPAGRALTLFLLLPLLGSFFILKGIDGLFEEAHKYAGLREVHTFSWPAFAALAVFLLLMFHVPPFRRGVVLGLWYFWRGLRGVLYDAPAAALRLPAVQRLLHSRAFRVAWQYLGKPLLWTAPVTLALWLFGAGPGWTLLVSAGLFAAVSALISTPAGMIVEEGVYYALARLWYAVSEDLLPGLFRLITWLSRRFIEGVDQVRYTVDEWLRFRQGQGRLTFTVKAVLGFFWFFITYLVRFVVVILIEPQINPIKHFPVVTVSHKLMLLIAPPVAASLEPYLGMSYKDTLALVILCLGLIPGMFGFLAWELKENWRLYRANQPKALVPQVVGSHGEQVIHLIRPGFHSGTLPKLFARLRRARGTAEHKGELGLHHVEDDLRRFAQRDLLAPLALSREWNLSASVSVGHLHLATNRILIELCCPGVGPDSAWLEFANRSGWLMARVGEPGWLLGVAPGPRAAFVTALTGFYKHAGVDLVAEHVEALLPPGARYEIRDDRLRVVGAGVSYDLREPDAPADGQPDPDLPATAAPLLFRLRPVSWHAWVERWEADQAGKGHEVPLLPGVVLLPAAAR